MLLMRSYFFWLIFLFFCTGLWSQHSLHYTLKKGDTYVVEQNALKESVRSEFGSRALSASFGQMTFIYPNGKDSLQRSWQNEYNGKFSAKNIWTLVKSTQAENHIKGQAYIEVDIEDKGTSMSLSGKQETTITADITTGFILDMLVEGYSEGTAMIDFTGDVSIPTTVRSTTSYKLIRN